MTASLRTLLGESVFSMLALWQQSTNRKVESIGRSALSGGLSGAILVPVRVRDRGQVRNAILKYCPADADGPNREPGAHDRALAVSPEPFRSDHLVELLFDPIVLQNGGSLMFQRIASGSLDDHTTLRAWGAAPELGAACRAVVASVLGGWNAPGPHAQVDVTSVKPGEHLERLLGYRLRPTHRLQQWLEREPAIWAAKGLRLAHPKIDEALVNPIAVLHSHPMVEHLRVPLTTGLTHGDLHVDNVIVPQSSTAGGVEAFRLIDLTTFESDGPLARDPLHLLLSVVNLYLPTLTPPVRRKLIDALVDGEPSVGVPPVLLGAIDGVRRGGLDWYGPDDRGDDWRVERLLALTACALMFVPRDHGSDADAPWWYFKLAACAITRYLADPASPPTRSAPPQRKTAEPIARPNGHDHDALPNQRRPADDHVHANASHRPASGGQPLTASQQPDPLDAAQRAVIVDVLFSVPFIDSHGHLDRIIRDLPMPVRTAVSHAGGDNLRTRVLDLISVLEARPHLRPWQTLVAVVRLHNGPAPEVDRLAEVIEELRLP
ncbi:hypothetical protein AB0K00_43320 [Dactylosporangium sp. NPDC049525]|uniref:hypothetical protein n=1 Tax=Dactylosporangium sp. NPDC049525 TaxID=3154730 RepID=UPI0034271C21